MEGQRISGVLAVLLGLAFLAEAAMMVGLAWAGWRMSDSTPVSLVLAVLLPAVAAAVWGLWCAPRARRRLPTLYRWAVKVTLFAATLALLLAFGPQPEAAVFAVLMWLAFLVSLPADRPLGRISAAH